MKFSAVEAYATTSNNAYINTMESVDDDIKNAVAHNLYSCSSCMNGGSISDVVRVIDELCEFGYGVVVSKENGSEWNLLIKWDKPSSEEGAVVIRDSYVGYSSAVSKLEKELRRFNTKK